MAKALLYRWFGLGGIPIRLRGQLEREGIRLMDEGVKGSVTLKGFRGPGRYQSWRRRWYIMSVILTESRLVGLHGSRTIINVPVLDERMKALDISVEKQDVLVVSFEAGVFMPKYSGRVECRFKTDQAGFFLERLRAIQGQV